MILAKEDFKVLAAAAENYPPGHGDSYFSCLNVDCWGDAGSNAGLAAQRLREDKDFCLAYG